MATSRRSYRSAVQNCRRITNVLTTSRFSARFGYRSLQLKRNRIYLLAPVLLFPIVKM